ncbi:MAG: hypothetical protein WCA81_07960 [Rhizomicrobium sp.]|jgi:hypothetical protein
MKHNLLRAVLAASFSLFVAGALTTIPSYGADTPKAPTISKSVSKQLTDAQKALTAKDWTTALAKLKEAQAVADLSDYDKYIISYYIGVAYYNLGDKVGAAAAFAAAAESPALPEKDRVQTLHNAMDLNLDSAVQNYAVAIEIGKIAEKLNILDATIAGNMAFAYYRQNDYPNALQSAQKSIDLATAAGNVPQRAAFEIMLQIEIAKKDLPGEMKTVEKLANLYGEPEDWANLITFSFGTIPPSKGYLEIAALYVGRLMLTVDVKSTADNYMLTAQAADAIRSPGDMLRALHTGINNGALVQSKVSALLNKAEATASRDKPTLATADAIAAKSPDAKADVSVAEDYFGYGNYADAARVAQRAIGKRGSQAIEAQLLLGVTQACQGNNEAAAQSLALVKGDPALEKAAYLWSLYATRKHGQAPVAAPAAAH